MMFSIRKSTAALALILIPLAGCSGGDGSPSFQTTTGQYQSLQFTATSRTAYQQSEKVTVTLVVTNTGTQSFTYDYGGCADNLALVQKQGQPLTTFDNLPPDTSCAGVVKHATFAPGQTRTFTQVWDQKIPADVAGQPSNPAPPGQYQIRSGIPVQINSAIPSAGPLTITIQ